MRPPRPTVDQLRNSLRYDSETGKLYWLPRTSDHIRNKGFNKTFAGREAFTSTTLNGYRQGALLGHNVHAHRVIWAMVNGEWPEYQIDHINGNRVDNRIVNLRHVERSKNQRNMKLRNDNTTGISGVIWYKRDKKWQVTIGNGSGGLYLGRFNCFAKAIQARRAAEIEFGYSSRHGKN